MYAQFIKYLQFCLGGWGGGVGVEGNSWEGYIVQMSLCFTLTERQGQGQGFMVA